MESTRENDAIEARLEFDGFDLSILTHTYSYKINPMPIEHKNPHTVNSATTFFNYNPMITDTEDSRISETALKDKMSIYCQHLLTRIVQCTMMQRTLQLTRNQFPQ